MSDRLELMREMQQAGLSHAEIGRRMGLSRERARQLLGNRKTSPAWRTLHRHRLRVLRWGILSGATQKEIAGRLGLSPTTVAGLLRRYFPNSHPVRHKHWVKRRRARVVIDLLVLKDQLGRLSSYTMQTQHRGLYGRALYFQPWSRWREELDL